MEMHSANGNYFESDSDNVALFLELTIVIILIVTANYIS